MIAAVDARLKAIDALEGEERPKSALELGAIERQRRDLLTGHDRGLVWDETEAVRAVRFAGLLKHWKRPFTGKSFVLEPWQEQLTIAPLFGWYREKTRADGGRRRFNTGYKEVPRKNGKTSEAAIIAAQGLVADGEGGAEVYAAATKRDQAVILFNDVKNMLRLSAIAKAVEIWAHSITCPQLNGSFKPLSADHNSLHGLNLSRGIVDEIHSHKTRDLWDVLATATGSRLDPLLFGITTAGFDRSTICWELHEYARRILDPADDYNDDGFFAYIAAAEADDDPFDPQTWWKANPNLDVSIRRERLADEAKKAAESPSYENTFRRLHLNQWTEQSVRWLPMHVWDACKGGESWDRLYDLLKGRECYAGLDLASTRDVNSLVLVFPLDDGRYVLLPFFWVPEDAHDDRGQRDRRQVMNWAEKGLIRKTPGNVTDYQTVAVDIMRLCDDFEIRQIAYDPWGPAEAFVQVLQQQGFPYEHLEKFRQNFGNFAAPTSEFERLVISRKLDHGGHPVLRWMAANVTVKVDPAGNIRPDKSKSSDKIDGIVASIMGLALAVQARGGPVGKFYETHEIEFA